MDVDKKSHHFQNFLQTRNNCNMYCIILYGIEKNPFLKGKRGLYKEYKMKRFSLVNRKIKIYRKTRAKLMQNVLN